MLKQERKMLFVPVPGACVTGCGWGWHPACLDTHTENHTENWVGDGLAESSRVIFSSFLADPGDLLFGFSRVMMYFLRNQRKSRCH